MMRNIQKAKATDNSVEIKPIVGQCVEEMTLEPEEPKVVIKQITPGFVAPALYHRLVAGARLGAIHDRLENWKVEVWDLPTKGRRKDLDRLSNV